MRMRKRPAMEVIRENVGVLIKRDKVYKACTLTKGKKIHFDKLSFLPDCAMGCFYGSHFEVRCQQLVLLDRKDTLTDNDSEECGQDNRDIVDDGSAQALKEGDILQLRAQASGQEVVGRVVEHSTSFKVKTRYSQQKYINKKQKKHAPVVSILKPSTRTLCEMYYCRGPSKICHMRTDTVSQILTYSNVHAHSNMIVVETTQGLLVAAMLERMGGFGKLVQVFFGDFPVKLAVDIASHLSDKDKAVLLEYPLHRIGSQFPAILQSSVISRNAESLPICGESLPICGEKQSTDSTTSTHAGQPTSPDSDEEKPLKRVKLAERIESDEEDSNDVSEAREMGSGNRENREKRRQEREERYTAAESLLQQRKMDGLVLACRFHPEPLLMALLGLLAPSRPVVVYCHLLEPLVECFRTLKDSDQELVFDIQISETWTRQYQVMPERTHPMMSMDAQGGYLLTATTVQKL